MASAEQTRWRSPTLRQQDRCHRRGLLVHVNENLIDYHRVLDAGDDSDSTTTFLAGLDVDAKYAFEALRRPRLRSAALGGCWLPLVRSASARY